MNPDAWLTFDVRLGYRNDGDPVHTWREIAHSRETRPLSCQLRGHDANDTVDEASTTTSYYDCEVMPLFTLGNCHHHNYLVNIRIPRDPAKNLNSGIGLIRDVWMVEIHQTGGFTMVRFRSHFGSFYCSHFLT